MPSLALALKRVKQQRITTVNNFFIRIDLVKKCEKIAAKLSETLLLTDFEGNIK